VNNETMRQCDAKSMSLVDELYYLEKVMLSL